MVKRPSFFKIFLPNLSTHCLKIPVDFIKNLVGKTSGTVTLMGPSGNNWHVELVNSNADGLFFQEGWPVFVKDHNVQIGEFFVFRYDGNLHFTVQIFDKSGCQKEAAFCAKSSQDTTSGFSEFNKNKRGKPSKSGFKNDPEAVTQKRIKVENVNLPMHETSGFVRNHPKRSNSSNVVTRGLSERAKAHRQNALRGFRMKRANSWNAASTFTSRFPYFVICITKHYVSKRLNIPACFSREHFQGYGKEFVLRDTEGRRWVVSLCSSQEHYSFIGGWLAFIHGNKIEMGDTLIFELVGKAEMCVHMFSGHQGSKIFTKKTKRKQHVAEEFV